MHTFKKSLCWGVGSYDEIFRITWIFVDIINSYRKQMAATFMHVCPGWKKKMIKRKLIYISMMWSLYEQMFRGKCKIQSYTENYLTKGIFILLLFSSEYRFTLQKTLKTWNYLTQDIFFTLLTKKMEFHIKKIFKITYFLIS